MMNSKELNLAKQYLTEILEYRAVLSHVLKRKVTVEQAMIDWIEKGYAQKHGRKKKNFD